MLSTGFNTAILAILHILLLSPSKAVRRPSDCQIWKSDIQKSVESVTVSRNYKGLWVSEKCEVLPGPQFILRSYHFMRNGKFHLTRFYYSDPWCMSAMFSVTVIGNFHPSPEKASSSSVSWVVPGGLELDYTLHRMNLVPFTAKQASDLASKVNSSCPGEVFSVWFPYKKYKVLQYDERPMRKRVYVDKSEAAHDMDCTSFLDLSFNELQLIRLENKAPLSFMKYQHHRPIAATTGRYSLLYLGAEGLESRGRRPTYYQVPLVSPKAHSCLTCRLLSKASSTSPPELHNTFIQQRMLASHLNGQWISMNCEVRPYGLFLKREFFFDNSSRQWTGRHDYFKDPLCKHPMFTLSAEGNYTVGQLSREVPDATEYNFTIMDSTVTPKDVQFANNLKGFPSCGSKESSWKIGHTVNLSSSRGCVELGIIVPSTELEIIRFDAQNPGTTFLQLGDGMGNERSRPTSFQLPLVRCSEFESDESDIENDLLFNHLRPLPLTSGCLQGCSFHHYYAVFILCVSILFSLNIHSH